MNEHSLQDAEAIWAAALEELALRAPVLLSRSELDPARRVYRSDEGVHKIVLSGLDITRRLRRQDLAGEFRILERCKGVRGVPVVRRFATSDQAQVIVMDLAAGQPLKLDRMGLTDACRTAVRLCGVLLELSRRGVSHGDVLPPNILVDDAGRLTLLDFDQALIHGRLAALRRNFLGSPIDQPQTHGSFRSVWEVLMQKYYGSTLLGRALRRARWILGSRDRQKAVENEAIPAIPDDAPHRLRDLRDAWAIARRSDASSPGVSRAYYALEVDGYRFPGERSWQVRWDVLRGLADFRGKRVLELGCNMSLLSCFVLADAGAADAFAVDTDPEILEAARLVAHAFDVSPTYARIDLDSDDSWEDELRAFQPDVVFALNVLNWVEQKERLLAFLGEWDTVIFEGHDSVEIETDRLRGVGFDRIELVELTERGRPLLVCSHEARN